MFKKFSKDEVSGLNQVKSSVARGVRASICEQMPWLEETGVIDTVIPKKEPMFLAKCPNYIQLCVVNNVPLFIQQRDGVWFPTLKLLHQYPDMMPKMRADQGAIKFVLSGANIMCPGLTSPGATIHNEVKANAAVAIYAEGKDHAMAVGLTKMTTEEIRTVNKGIGVDNIHHLNDGLWKMKGIA